MDAVFDDPNESQWMQWVRDLIRAIHHPTDSCGWWWQKYILNTHHSNSAIWNFTRTSNQEMDDRDALGDTKVLDGCTCRYGGCFKLSTSPQHQCILSYANRVSHWLHPSTESENSRHAEALVDMKELLGYTGGCVRCHMLWSYMHHPPDTLSRWMTGWLRMSWDYLHDFKNLLKWRLWMT